MRKSCARRLTLGQLSLVSEATYRPERMLRPAAVRLKAYSDSPWTSAGESHRAYDNFLHLF